MSDSFNRASTGRAPRANTQQLGITESGEKIDCTVLDWARRFPIDQIPALLVFLSSRLLLEGRNASGEGDVEKRHAAGKLLTAGELATTLDLPESWIRNQERAGRIQSVRAGKYVRFRVSEVERTFAKAAPGGPK